MKQTISIVLLYCLFFNLGVYGQTVESFEKFNIRNTSGQVLEAITAEFRSGNNAARFRSLANERREIYLPNEEATRKYLEETNNIIGKTRNKQEAQLVLTKSRAELLKYSSDVIANFADVIPDSFKKIKKFNAVGNFGIPAFERAVELYANKQVEDKIIADRKNMDEIILSRITLLYTKNKELDLTTATNENAFRAMFELSQADIPALNREDYAVVNKELVKYAFRFMNDLKNDIVKIRQQINERNNEQNEEEFNKVKADYTEKISQTELRITKEVREHFGEVGNEIRNLAINQDKIKTQLNKLQTSVEENKRKIDEQEKQMQGLKKQISSLRSDVSNLQANVGKLNAAVTQLNETQNLHSKLIAENSFKTDVLLKYTFFGLKPDAQLKGLEDGDFDSVFSITKKEELKSQLKDIILVEGIVDISNKVSQYATEGYEALVSSGILKGKDAENVGKFLHYLVASSQVATGAARIYGGDITGAISVLQGLSGLITGVKKPKPSPEFQMLEAVYSKLTDIETRIVKIEKDIAEFRIEVIKMYNSLSTSLQMIAEKIEILDWKTDVLRDLTIELLRKDYKSCISDYEDKTKANVKFLKYTDYDRYFDESTTKPCLQGLSQFADTQSDTFFYLSAVSPSTNRNRFADREILDVYNPTKDLFKKIHNTSVSTSDQVSQKRVNNLLQSLMLPVAKTNAVSEPFLILNQMEETGPEIRIETLENYLNYEMILQFSEYFLIYSPYLEIAEVGFRPPLLESYLQRITEQRALSSIRQNRRIIKLIKLTENSIKQHSLLAGNGLLDDVYAILFYPNAKREDILLVNKLLTNNKLLAYNFATYWLNKNLSSNSENYKKIIPIIEEIRSTQTASKEQLDNLNKFLIHNTNSTNITFQFRTEDKRLYLSFTKEGATVDILVPESSVIIENRMINSGAIPLLINMREILSEKLLDQNFTENIPKVYSYTDSNNQKVEISGETYFKYIFANSIVESPVR